MQPFEYHRAVSLEQALDLAVADGAPRSALLAGGTDLLTLIKAGVSVPSRLIDIKRLDLRGIDDTADGVIIKALTSLEAIAESALIAERYPLLTEAARSAATPQLRHMATLGGNLLQRPRCWYFRNPRFECWLKGGHRCPARYGENQRHGLFSNSECCAVHPSDLAACLVALDASVLLVGREARERWLPLERFFALPNAQHRTGNVLEHEVIAAVRVPRLTTNVGTSYCKAMERKSWSFALVGAAVVLGTKNDIVDPVRIVLSGVASIPWRARAAERVLARRAARESALREAAAAATDDAEPLSKNAYKMPLLRAIVRRALMTAIERARR